MSIFVLKKVTKMKGFGDFEIRGLKKIGFFSRNINFMKLNNYQILLQSVEDDQILDEPPKSKEKPHSGEVQKISGAASTAKTGDKTCHLCVLNRFGMLK